MCLYASPGDSTVYANEEFVGTAIHESGLARQDLFITTKYDGGEVLDAVHASLRKVRLSYSVDRGTPRSKHVIVIHDLILIVINANVTP